MKIVMSNKEHREVVDMLTAIDEDYQFPKGAVTVNLFHDKNSVEVKIDEKYLLSMMTETNRWLPAIKLNIQGTIELLSSLYNSLIEREKSFSKTK